MITYFIITIIGFMIIKYRFFWEVKNENKFPKNGTIFMSHRGYKKVYPENTMGAFKRSVELDFEWIELDIIATKDNVIICSHNFDLEQETNGTGDIDKFNYIDLSYLTTGIYRSNLNKEKLPKLVDVINKLPKSINFNIEIKAPKIFDFKTARALKKIFIKLPTHRILISSFNPFVLFYFKIFYPKIRTAFLYQNIEYLWIINWLHPTYLHPRADLVVDSLINDCKGKNLDINVWTVNNKAAVEWCINKNLNGIITDRGPDLWE
tara:strand:- start:3856 stop:4647 length:792 start_codon:yes stop_codon:yes gene_type:complete